MCGATDNLTPSCYLGLLGVLLRNPSQLFSPIISGCFITSNCSITEPCSAINQSDIIWEVNTLFQFNLTSVVTSCSAGIAATVPSDEVSGPDPDASGMENRRYQTWVRGNKVKKKIIHLRFRPRWNCRLGSRLDSLVFVLSLVFNAAWWASEKARAMNVLWQFWLSWLSACRQLQKTGF